MTIDLNALEKAARLATPGPWTDQTTRFNKGKDKRKRDWWAYLVVGRMHGGVSPQYADLWDYHHVIELNWYSLKGRSMPGVIKPDDLAYLCAASPDVVLALIERVRTAEGVSG